MGRALILHPDDLDAAADDIGGKARGLLYIHRAGLPVPAWRVLSFAVVAARAWREEAGLRYALAAVFETFAARVAVRSSAAAEDGVQSSHAGQFHTAFADSFDGLLGALDAVADSAQGAPMAIVLQQALEPTFAGVAFSADPACARADTLYLEAVAGHGKHLVDGDATPVGVHFSMDGTLVAQEGAERFVGVDLAVVANAILALEVALDAAVDIEWAVAGGAFYVLQARPLTALQADAALRPRECHTSWFFDQRFLRPISPFTRSTLVPLIVRASVGSALAMRGRDPSEAAAIFYGGQAYVPHRAYHAMLAGAPRWWLSPDLLQLYPRVCACVAPAPRGNDFGYAWDALRAVLHNRRAVFLNTRVWAHFRDTLCARIESACGAPTLVERWRGLDALSEEFLAIHRWSILWADYFFRLYTVIARVIGGDRAKRWLLGGMRLATAEANVARAAGHAVARGFGDRSASLDYAVPTWRELYPDAVAAAPAEGASGGSKNLFRRFLEMREEQRLNWEHILARQRALVLERAAQLGLGAPEDVWLLTWDEFVGALPSREEIGARRHALYVESLVPKPLFLGPDDSQPVGSGTEVVQGVGASAGLVRGTIVHLRNPAAGLPTGCPRPCILVVPALDPGSTGLMQQVDGIVAERGGLLSHAAILAREYGVPMVTALEGAFSLLPAGAQARLDGQRGRVQLERP